MSVKMNLSVSAIHHIALRSRDPQRLAHFYQTLFSCTQQRVQHDEHGVRSVWLRVNDGVLLMFERELRIGTKSREVTHNSGYLLAFKMHQEDCALWLERLNAHAVTVIDKTAYTLYFLDPEDNPVALSCYE